jgi:hypothetical protein
MHESTEIHGEINGEVVFIGNLESKYIIPYEYHSVDSLSPRPTTPIYPNPSYHFSLSLSPKERERKMVRRVWIYWGRGTR